MLGLVVVPFVFLQNLQQSDAAGGEETVGADDDQEHGHEVKGQGFQGVFSH